MKSPSVSKDEWLAAFESALLKGSNGGGTTIRELAKLSGFGIAKSQEAVRELVERGMITVSHRRILDISGRWSWVPTYLLLRKPRKSCE